MPSTSHDGLQALTAREREVLRLFAQGLEGPEVARALNLSAKTVETHVRNARAKLGGVRRPAAARMVAEEERSRESIAFQSFTPPAATISSPRASSGMPDSTPPRHQAGVNALGGGAEMVREDRAIFLHLPSPAPPQFTDRNTADQHPPALTRLLTIAGLGFAVMAALALVAPVTDGIQRWADAIHRHSSN
ncbi:helix-turn-helix transcriptional regulator [uncultured Sphingomonas sp.]|uniref:response regulator transcription factor n=1 Tax=uncultured Sphingomonas sp. TaxID=158754 RepID=UPI0025D79800|nr:helix-turn-helix transcriptional regulator [uncultured Sphingomonas sp.]